MRGETGCNFTYSTGAWELIGSSVGVSGWNIRRGSIRAKGVSGYADQTGFLLKTARVIRQHLGMMEAEEADQIVRLGRGLLAKLS